MPPVPGFLNSYGTPATRSGSDPAEPVHPFVALRNIRFDHLDELTAAVGRIVTERAWAGEPVDFLDGVVFAPDESYLVLGSWSDREPRTSDYTGQRIYYRSLPQRTRDALTVHDYLWRWDTDWFWCSRAFGAQNPRIRRLWPARWRRSDVYHRLVGLENRFHVASRVDAWRGLPARERVIQDVEIPLSATADFLDWFAAHVPMAPVWLCPLRLRSDGGALGEVPDGTQPWPLYPLVAGQTYVNVGFWGTVPIVEGAMDGDVNRRLRRPVTFGGHKSLYSTPLRRGVLLGLIRRPGVRPEGSLRPRLPPARPLRQGRQTSVGPGRTQQRFQTSSCSLGPTLSPTVMELRVTALPAERLTWVSKSTSVRTPSPVQGAYWREDSGTTISIFLSRCLTGPVRLARTGTGFRLVPAKATVVFRVPLAPAARSTSARWVTLATA